MIEKLKRRIRLIIVVSLSVIMIGVVVFYSVTSYREAINSAAGVMDKFSGGPGPGEGKPGETENGKNAPLATDVEGVYRFSIDNNGNVTDLHEKSGEAETDTEIKSRAAAVAKKSGETGISGDYIYRKMNFSAERQTEVMLIESADTVKRIKINVALTVGIGVFAVALIYFIAGRITLFIVKPVEQTFEKQKQFISDASHELKTPLAVIEANTGVLEAETGENKWITYINNEVESMNKLVNDLLTLARTENSAPDNMQKTDLSKLVEIITAGFESMAYEKGTQLLCHVEPGITYTCDKEDIKHILSTLIDNAVKHTQSGKKITVSLDCEKGDRVIRVSNEGEPIPPQDREKIFERFYRVDKARNREEKRYGLGLAIAKQCAEKYGGRIYVDCENGVTVFTVILR